MNLDNLMVMDWETTGDLPEHSLQSWRIPQGKAWGTSLVWLRREAGQTIYGGGVLASDDLPQAEVHDRCRAMAREMLEDAIARKAVIGGWNLVFDIAILIAYGLEDLVAKCRFLDGMLLWRHFYIEPEYDLNRDKKKSYGLKTFVAENFPQLAGYEDEIDFHDSSPEARKKLHRYNQRDCLATYAGIKLLWERLTPEQRRAALIEAQCLPMVAGANFRGLPVDPLATRELQASLVVTAGRCLSELAPFGVTEATVRSPTKLGKLLFDDWGLPVLKENVGAKTKIVSRATDKEVLHELAFKDPRARTLHQYREALGNKTKFADNILDSAAYNEDGRTHPQAIPFSCYTSRMSYASKQGKNKAARPIGFAVHQEKGKAEGKFYRAAIVPPEGYDLVEFDAAGQEFRWMAILSGDEAMLALCLPGEDAHSFMGSQISNVDYRKLIDLVQSDDHNAKAIRTGGKFSNLCVAEGTVILTDRGVCCIEDVRLADKVWDGLEFVRHAGVICSGVKTVIAYSGLVATPEHEVLVDGGWVSLAEAAETSSEIARALGEGWARRCRSAVRIVDSLVRRLVHEKSSALCAGAVRLWPGARSQFTVYGDWAIEGFQRCATKAMHRSFGNLVCETLVDRRLQKRTNAWFQRCDNPKDKSYRNYGARGIRCYFSSVSEAVAYIKESLPHPTYLKVDIDRRDNNGHYERGNLRLVSRRVNLNNTRRNVWVVWHGQRVRIRDWEQNPYSLQCAGRYVAAGMTGEEIIDQAWLAVAEKRKGWQTIRARLECMTSSTAGRGCGSQPTG